MNTRVREDAPDTSAVFDAAVIGAGFSGLYMTLKLRELGLTVQAFDAASDVGGVWNWNRYPGARTDSTHFTYCYSFSPELLAEWGYSERFPSQSEVLQYLGLVADKFDLRKHYQFDTRVESAVFDETTGRWNVVTDRGDSVSAKYLVTGLGLVSEPNVPHFANLEAFGGELYHTSRWPQDDVSFAGKRVAVIGTGSSGIQIIPQIAKEAEHLTVFQRTPNYVVPSGNGRVSAEDLEQIRNNYDELWRRVRANPAGHPFVPAGRLAVETDAEERTRIFQEMWDRGGFSFLFESFDDLMVNREANDMAVEFLRDKIQDIVTDPDTAAKLTPDYPYAAKRPPVGDGFYQAFNRSNVDLVDVQKSPIVQMTESGILTTESEYEFDCIVLATGFDASTGSFLRMDIRGRDGRSLRDHWSAGPSTLLGLAIAGFPNLFMVAGPQSPFSNLPPGAEQEAGWIADCIGYMRENGIEFMEPTDHSEVEWTTHVREAAEQTLTIFGEAVNSWFVGANIDGKPHAFNVYFGGANVYADKCDEEAANGYPQFQKSTKLAELV